MLGPSVAGIVTPLWANLAFYHPTFALAIVEGADVRPNVRILSVQFPGSASIGTVKPASFAAPVSAYSVFAGCAETIDPTGQTFQGNILKYVNDAGQAKVTGITFTLLARTRGDDYTPIPDETPLQFVPSLLSVAAGVWKLNEPADNVKATFTLAAQPNTPPPFTAWVGFVFLVLSKDAAGFLCMDRRAAYAELQRRGLLCCPPQATSPGT
jgi:hypothetical protein